LTFPDPYTPLLGGSKLAAVVKSLAELGQILGGEVSQNGDCTITGIAGLETAGQGEISYVLNERYLPRLAQSAAAAVIVPRQFPAITMPCVRVDNVALAVELTKAVFYPPVAIPPGVHPSALIGKRVSIGNGVAIMANVVVQDGVAIGEGSTLYPGVYVGHDSVIGKSCILYPNCVVRERITLGDRVVLQPGAVIGADGFGYDPASVPHRKIGQVGAIILGDDVEIGANTTIDRATLDLTVVRRGTKIDNLVQVAHNVVIGEDCLISSQTGIAGSTTVGDNVILGGQVGVGDHVKIGHNVVVAAKSGVTKPVPDGEIVYGNPAGQRGEKQREVVSLRKVPQLAKLLKELNKRVQHLEQAMGLEASAPDSVTTSMDKGDNHKHDRGSL
jgi:UDP-3-O-[3-hydroxymyristoyl] glucosamine N-acyltransferase